MIHFVLLGRLPPRRCLDAGTAEPQYLLYSDKIRRAGACAGGRATSGKSPRSAESQSSVSFSSSLRGRLQTKNCSLRGYWRQVTSLIALFINNSRGETTISNRFEGL